MSISLLNFGMLAGLVGIAVPILVHLLNRRRFDVVSWGAMQFLQLGERTRQRIKLSDLLLLLLRMGLVAILVFAFTRPYAKGNTWIRSLHPEPVDLVVIIDGSYSMGWTGEVITPHARAIQTCHQILDELTSVDRVAIIDARDRAYLLTPAPLTDTANARLELEKIQRPDGSANLVAALTQACQLLTQSFSTRREVLILTDQQQSSWKLVDQALWNEMLKIRHTAAVPIEFSAIDVGSSEMETGENFEVDRLTASRELVVTDSPVHFTTRVRYRGPLDETTTELFWSIDGQQLSRNTEVVKLRRGEQAIVQFSTRFADPGFHRVTASVAHDDLPGDDQADCIVQVLEELPAVIAVSGHDHENRPREQRTAEYYLKTAFGDSDLAKVWVDARVIPMAELTSRLLQPKRVVFLVGELPEDFSWTVLNEFLAQGGAVVVLPTANSTPAHMQRYNSWQVERQPVLPLQFSRKRDLSEEERFERLQMASLAGSWLERFKVATGSDLGDALFGSYWELTPQEAVEAEAGSGTERQSTPAPAGVRLALSPVSIDARLQSGDPLFARRFVGRGQVLVWGASLDAAGNDLVRMRSFVPFLHEMVFGLTRTASNQNVQLGQPLLVRQLSCQPLTIPVKGPDDNLLTAQRSGRQDQLQWALAPPKLSGIYTFQTDCQVGGTGTATLQNELPFAVHASREESVLQRLTTDELDLLQRAYGFRWKPDARTMLTDLATASAGIELWPFLLFLVTGLLVLELLMTRRLVQGGHAHLEDQEAEGSSSPQAASVA